jgi:hypothetical protein
MTVSYSEDNLFLWAFYAEHPEGTQSLDHVGTH